MKNNKKYYEQAKIEYETIVMEFVDGIRAFDKTITFLPPKDYMLKLNRDTRFRKDKSPYNPSFRAHISKGGRLPIPVGYYLNIQPENIFLGGGLFASMFSEATKGIRDYIVKNEKSFISIIETKEFKNNFVIDGEKLKNVPREYDKEHKLSEYLKYKSWFLEYKMKDKIFLENKVFMKTALEIFKCMKPFNDFINRALIDFKMPERN